MSHHTVIVEQWSSQTLVEHNVTIENNTVATTDGANGLVEHLSMRHILVATKQTKHLGPTLYRGNHISP